MGWSTLGTQFCLELAFGVLFALAFVPRAPVGKLFYRLIGTVAVLPLLVASFAPVLWGNVQWKDPVLITTLFAVLAFPAFSGPFRGLKWAASLAWSLFWTALALVLALNREGASGANGTLLLGSLSAMATGSVAGSVSLAMVLGHWYLTIPNLQLRHLERMNRVSVVSICVSLIVVAVTCWIFRERLDSEDAPLTGSWGLFCIGTRIISGLLLPLLFAWMASESLKFRNTRSATGILYASTILVLIGTAVSISLQDSYGIPL